MVTLMRKSKIIILCIIVLTFTLSPLIVKGEKPFVFDDAMLFTNEEKVNLDAEANYLSESYNMDIVIVTTNNALGKSSTEYADDYFDYGGFGVGENYDGILFLIDMDNREAYISTSGIGVKYLTDERIDSILDMVFDGGLIEGNYYGAAMEFLKGTKTFLERGIPSDQHTVPEKVVEPNKLTSFEAILSGIVGTIVASIFYFVTKAKYKMKNAQSSYSYKANSFVNLTSREDKLINTFVTHRRIPKPKPTNTSSSSTSGRSTTHRSSSGRTHGGGGRKF